MHLVKCSRAVTYLHVYGAEICIDFTPCLSLNQSRSEATDGLTSSIFVLEIVRWFIVT